VHQPSGPDVVDRSWPYLSVVTVCIARADARWGAEFGASRIDGTVPAPSKRRPGGRVGYER
jgi:hypothetical protein